jgi:DNA-binding response OmpR family regulator
MLLSRPTINNPPKSILVVDDDTVILKTLAYGFKQYGFTVFEAENGLDAWNLFNEEQIDLVLTDVEMPKMNGKELVNCIRNQSTTTVIAVMTGGKTDTALELLENRKADYFFPKPFDIRSVLRILISEVQVICPTLKTVKTGENVETLM